MEWIMKEGHQESEIDRIGNFLDSILKRYSLQDTLKEDYLTCEFYKGRVLKIAVSRFILSALEISSIDMAITRDILDVQNYIIYLILEGEAQKAFDIAKFAGSLKFTQDPNLDESTKKPGKDLFMEVRQYKILKALIKFLQKGKLPSKKALRLKSSSSGMREEDFSEAISKMKIFPLLPNSSNRGAPKEGTVHILKPIFEDYLCFDAEQNTKQPDEFGGILSGNSPCLINSRKAEAFRSKVIKMRQRLGPAYSLFLIQFGMTGIDTQKDYNRFKSNLSSIGLELK